jgi:hypothetical protein
MLTFATLLAVGTIDSAASGKATAIVVSSKQAWTSTGLTVRRGEILELNATGEIQLSEDAADIASTAGSKAGRYAINSQLPRNFAGALIARIGDGEPFPVGNLETVIMPSSGPLFIGPLFIGVNDDSFEDNSGEFRVEISRTGRRLLAHATMNLLHARLESDSQSSSDRIPDEGQPPDRRAAGARALEGYGPVRSHS